MGAIGKNTHGDTRIGVDGGEACVDTSIGVDGKEARGDTSIGVDGGTGINTDVDAGIGGVNG